MCGCVLGVRPEIAGTPDPIYTYLYSQEPIDYYSMREALLCLRGKSQIRFSLSSSGFSESGIHLTNATGKPLGFL